MQVGTHSIEWQTPTPHVSHQPTLPPDHVIRCHCSAFRSADQISRNDLVEWVNEKLSLSYNKVRWRPSWLWLWLLWLWLWL
jgi:hypothetical protein